MPVFRTVSGVLERPRECAGRDSREGKTSALFQCWRSSSGASASSTTSRTSLTREGAGLRQKNKTPAGSCRCCSSCRCCAAAPLLPTASDGAGAPPCVVGAPALSVHFLCVLVCSATSRRHRRRVRRQIWTVEDPKMELTLPGVELEKERTRIWNSLDNQIVVSYNSPRSRHRHDSPPFRRPPLHRHVLGSRTTDLFL